MSTQLIEQFTSENKNANGEWDVELRNCRLRTCVFKLLATTEPMRLVGVIGNTLESWDESGRYSYKAINLSDFDIVRVIPPPAVKVEVDSMSNDLTITVAATTRIHEILVSKSKRGFEWQEVIDMIRNLEISRNEAQSEAANYLTELGYKDIAVRDLKTEVARLTTACSKEFQSVTVLNDQVAKLTIEKQMLQAVLIAQGTDTQRIHTRLDEILKAVTERTK